jgi:hypothetical protein
MTSCTDLLQRYLQAQSLAAPLGPRNQDVDGTSVVSGSLAGSSASAARQTAVTKATAAGYQGLTSRATSPTSASVKASLDILQLELNACRTKPALTRASATAGPTRPSSVELRAPSVPRPASVAEAPSSNGAKSISTLLSDWQELKARHALLLQCATPKQLIVPCPTPTSVQLPLRRPQHIPSAQHQSPSLGQVVSRPASAASSSLVGLASSGALEACRVAPSWRLHSTGDQQQDIRADVRSWPSPAPCSYSSRDPAVLPAVSSTQCNPPPAARTQPTTLPGTSSGSTLLQRMADKISVERQRQNEYSQVLEPLPAQAPLHIPASIIRTRDAAMQTVVSIGCCTSAAGGRQMQDDLVPLLWEVLACASEGPAAAQAALAALARQLQPPHPAPVAPRGGSYDEEGTEEGGVRQHRHAAGQRVHMAVASTASAISGHQDHAQLLEQPAQREGKSALSVRDGALHRHGGSLAGQQATPVAGSEPQSHARAANTPSLQQLLVRCEAVLSHDNRSRSSNRSNSGRAVLASQSQATMPCHGMTCTPMAVTALEPSQPGTRQGDELPSSSFHAGSSSGTDRRRPSVAAASSKSEGRGAIEHTARRYAALHATASMVALEGQVRVPALSAEPSLNAGQYGRKMTRAAASTSDAAGAQLQHVTDHAPPSQLGCDALSATCYADVGEPPTAQAAQMDAKGGGPQHREGVLVQKAAQQQQALQALLLPPLLAARVGRFARRQQRRAQSGSGGRRAEQVRVRDCGQRKEGGGYSTAMLRMGGSCKFDLVGSCVRDGKAMHVKDGLGKTRNSARSMHTLHWDSCCWLSALWLFEEFGLGFLL